jgi:hypothetical protein
LTVIGGDIRRGLNNGDETMTLKTGILAAATALTLIVPAAAMAQPYGPGYGYAPGYVRYDWRRIERERDFRRAEEFRRLEWQRAHAFRDYGYRGGWYGH